MTAEEYVAPEFHSEESDRFLLKVAAAILDTPNMSLEQVSAERTSLVFNEAVAAGFTEEHAHRLAGHLDAGTEKMNALPAEQRAHEYGRQKEIIRNFFAASMGEQEAFITRMEAAKSQLRKGQAPTI